MFSNYFFLKRLVASLLPLIKGLELIECYSQNKDELVIGLADENSTFWIKANLDPNISLIEFPDDVSRARRNSVDLFTTIKGLKVESCDIFKFERSFEIRFENNHSLIFKMHGRRANVLHSMDNNVDEIFRNSLSTDLALIPNELSKEITLTEQSFAECNYSPIALIPALGKKIQQYWIENYDEFPASKKWNLFQELLKELDSNPFFIDEEGADISLLPIDNADQTDDPIEASNRIYRLRTRGFYFEKEKDQTIHLLNQRKRKSESYIFKTSEKLRVIQSKRSPDEIANTIMANLTLIEKGLDKVILQDVYSNEFIEIKLNPKLTPQKNAETYYRKSKNRHQEIESLEGNITEKQRSIEATDQLIHECEEITSAKALKQFRKKNKLDSAKPGVSKNNPYHEFELDGWRVLVGKNAKANDELTLKIATKNDLWLHAKDVSGSHVVIKEHPGQNYPVHVIEYAAALAAFNSRRKTDSLCPVIYTQKKFVRKTKGAMPGEVIVEKEQVLMVEPHQGD